MPEIIVNLFRDLKYKSAKAETRVSADLIARLSYDIAQ